MQQILDRPVADRTAWKSADLAAMDWTIALDAADVADLDHAVQAVKAAGFAAKSFGRGDFPLGRMRERLDEALALLKDGPGVARLRGVPVERYDPADLERLYWGIGVHLGLPMGQNRRGDRLGRVEADPGLAPTKLGQRGYNRPSALPFHCDMTDVVGLLCIRPARAGGTSVIASMTAIHDHILEHRPDLLPPLYAGMHTALRGDGGLRTDDELSPDPVPVFEYYGGKLSCFFVLPRFLGAQEVGGHALTPLQLEALHYVHDLTQDPAFAYPMEFAPGDIQLLNNYVTLHARTDYQDDPEPDRRRLLLRLWLRLDEEDYRLSPQRAHILRWGMDEVRPAMA